ncbi:hypothetical protein CHKEEEPN_4640 [Methylorubrum podarium]|nr:hypothetical protein CHKEEEPN_4640 [Methylorubrum podarium]
MGEGLGAEQRAVAPGGLGIGADRADHGEIDRGARFPVGMRPEGGVARPERGGLRPHQGAGGVDFGEQSGLVAHAAASPA